MSATSPNAPSWAIGLMCGTSLDGVDAAAVGFDERGAVDARRVGAHLTLEFEDLDAQRLRDIAAGAATTAEEISRLRFALAREEQRAVEALCRRLDVAPRQLAYVASHGITLSHCPQDHEGHGWQLHAGAALAALLQCTVVDEFRAADLALGGQGAPLAPLADLVLRASKDEHRAILNLGGIANITVLPRGATEATELVCGDVGPANLPLDEIARQELGRHFDEGGTVALEGRVDERVCEALLKEAWVRHALPRSFGREQFGVSWVESLQERMSQATTADRLATLVAVEVGALRSFLEEFVDALDAPLHCYVTGGGRHHRGWWQRAEAELAGVRLHGIEELGVSADAKEAVDFAFLGGQTLLQKSARQSALTGASRDLVLGCIHRPLSGLSAESTPS